MLVIYQAIPGEGVGFFVVLGAFLTQFYIFPTGKTIGKAAQKSIRTLHQINAMKYKVMGYKIFPALSSLLQWM